MLQQMPGLPDFVTSARHPSDLPVPGYVPTRVVFGNGAADSLDTLVRDRLGPGGFHRILVLTGRTTADKSWFAPVLAGCQRLGTTTVVANPRANPTPESIQSVLDTARRLNVDGVIAVGGGSVLDTGKAVALLAGGEHSVGQAIRTKSAGPRGIGLVAVPTTAGSGAEVTRTSTVWDEKGGRKLALDHPGLFPDLAVVDPLVTMSAPAQVWAGCGLDALSQAVESSWAVAADAESLRFSLPAVRMAADGLDGVLADPGSEEARARLSCASLFAGLSIARTRTTLPHAVSYPLTLRLGIAHGHACALTLGAVLRFNASVGAHDCRDPRGVDHSRDALRAIQDRLGAPTPAAAQQRLTALVRRLGLPALRDLGPLDFRDLVEEVMSYDRSENNPRRMTPDQLSALLRAEGTR